MPVFTTRPDTLFGVTFMVFAPDHPKVQELTKDTAYEQRIREFIALQSRFETGKEKEGLFVGRHAINPVNGEEIPIFVANFVLMEYGTGFIMAVPAHDQRDFEFAKKHNIPIRVVIQPECEELKANEMKEAFVGQGVLVQSGPFTDLKSDGSSK